MMEVRDIDVIDMTKLNQRELLILLNERIGKMSNNISQFNESRANTDIRLAKMEMTVRIYSIISGAIASTLITLAFKFI